MEDEKQFDNFVNNIHKGKVDKDSKLLNDFRIAADPMEYLKLDSDDDALKDISSEESEQQEEQQEWKMQTRNRSLDVL